MPAPTTSAARLDDSHLVERIGGGDHAAFEALMRQYNRRLFRVARSILRNDAEAEDALQDAYLEAFRHLGEFRGEAQLATWLTRIVVTRSLMSVRKSRRFRQVVPIDASRGTGDDPPAADVPDARAESPRDAAFRAEVRRMIERRIDELPLNFRTVFVMREVEDLTVQETAECLSIPEATVRTRLFRARGLMREALARDMDMAAVDAFAFAGGRCDRIVAHVLGNIAALPRIQSP